MRDMTLEDLCGAPSAEHVLTYADGGSRRVYTVDYEVPFPDGRLIVSRTDQSGVITRANESFVAMSGWPMSELIGEPHYIMRHPDMPAAVFRDLWHTVGHGLTWHGYVKNLRKDGAYYWVYASIVPNIRHGHVVGYTSVRRKASRRMVAEAAAQYGEMR
jgi:PAS domain S-box-containing protein